MPEKTAKRLGEAAGSWTGTAYVYELSEPTSYKETKTTKYVVASSMVPMFGLGETLVFPSKKNGEVLDWGDLAGQRKLGAWDEVIEELGYKVVKA